MTPAILGAKEEKIMIKTIKASVTPESVTGYHQRFEYDTEEGVCTEYRIGCSPDSFEVRETEPMTEELWTRRCAGFRAQFLHHKRNFPDYSFHLEIDGETVV